MDKQIGLRIDGLRVGYFASYKYPYRRGVTHIVHSDNITLCQTKVQSSFYFCGYFLDYCVECEKCKKALRTIINDVGV